MQTNKSFVQQYLTLINTQISNPPSLEFLSELQLNHLQSLAWTTLDVFLGKTITLDPNIILEKFIVEKKGGLCYELNGAFCYLLQQLGFDAHLSTCFAVHYHNSPFDFPSDTHAVIIVNLDNNKYLVEVGYGDLFNSPIKIQDQFHYQDRSGSYRILFKNDLNRYQLEMLCGEEWIPQYHFEIEPRDLISFKPNLEVVYQHPTYQKLNFIQFHPDGTQIIKDDQYIVQHLNQRKTFSFESLGGLTSILQNKLGFNL